MIRNRRQLINWLIENAPARYLQRAVSEGQVEFLGWFKSIPGSVLPGWIVRATSSISNPPRSWNVVVRKHPYKPNVYASWVAQEIKWSQWNIHNSESPFMRGDRHEIYERLRQMDYVGDGSEVSSDRIWSEPEQRNNQELDNKRDAEQQ